MLDLLTPEGWKAELTLPLTLLLSNIVLLSGCLLYLQSGGVECVKAVSLLCVYLQFDESDSERTEAMC